MELEGRRVLVTGSSRGIGRAIAARCLAEGARVAINGRSAEACAAVAAELGPGAVAAPGDLCRADTCTAVVAQAVDALGGLDVLVNNAGVFTIASIEDTDEATWDAAMATNVKAAFFASRAALPALRDSDAAVIINHASIAGLIGLANVAAYCASKGALVQLTRAGDGARARGARQLRVSDHGRQRDGLARLQPQRRSAGRLPGLRRGQQDAAHADRGRRGGGVRVPRLTALELHDRRCAAGGWWQVGRRLAGRLMQNYCGGRGRRCGLACGPHLSV